MKVRIDSTTCQGHGRCASFAPDVFEVDDYGMSSVIGDGTVAPADHAGVRLAVANCPEFAVEILDS